MLTQKLWLKDLDWDTQLEGDLKSEFYAAVGNLAFAKELKFDRSLFSLRREFAKGELHVLADGSLLWLRGTRAKNSLGRPAEKTVGQVHPRQGACRPVKGKMDDYAVKIARSNIATYITKCIEKRCPTISTKHSYIPTIQLYSVGYETSPNVGKHSSPTA